MQPHDSAGQYPPRVLVVDDDRLLTSILAKVLAADGYVVDVAHDGQQGLERASSAAPAAVIVDLTMPVMDGFEFIEAFVHHLSTLRSRSSWRPGAARLPKRANG